MRSAVEPSPTGPKRKACTVEKASARARWALWRSGSDRSPLPPQKLFQAAALSRPASESFVARCQETGRDGRDELAMIGGGLDRQRLHEREEKRRDEGSHRSKPFQVGLQRAPVRVGRGGEGIAREGRVATVERDRLGDGARAAVMHETAAACKMAADAEKRRGAPLGRGGAGLGKPVVELCAEIVKEEVRKHARLPAGTVAQHGSMAGC